MDYLAVRESLAAGNSTWTAFSKDPKMAQPRRAFLLNSTHVGVDLLAESAAALALASLVVQRTGGDPARATAFRSGAESLYALARSTKDAEQSYCAFIPCSAAVTVKRVVPVGAAAEQHQRGPARHQVLAARLPRAPRAASSRARRPASTPAAKGPCTADGAAAARPCAPRGCGPTRPRRRSASRRASDLGPFEIKALYTI